MEVAREGRRGEGGGEEVEEEESCGRGGKVMVFVFIYVASYYILM